MADAVAVVLQERPELFWELPWQTPSNPCVDTLILALGQLPVAALDVISARAATVWSESAKSPTRKSALVVLFTRSASLRKVAVIRYSANQLHDIMDADRSLALVIVNTIRFLANFDDSVDAKRLELAEKTVAYHARYLLSPAPVTATWKPSGNKPIRAPSEDLLKRVVATFGADGGILRRFLEDFIHSSVTSFASCGKTLLELLAGLFGRKRGDKSLLGHPAIATLIATDIREAHKSFGDGGPVKLKRKRVSPAQVAQLRREHPMAYKLIHCATNHIVKSTGGVEVGRRQMKDQAYNIVANMKRHVPDFDSGEAAGASGEEALAPTSLGTCTGKRGGTDEERRQLIWPSRTSL